MDPVQIYNIFYNVNHTEGLYIAKDENAKLYTTDKKEMAVKDIFKTAQTHMDNSFKDKIMQKYVCTILKDEADAFMTKYRDHTSGLKRWILKGIQSIAHSFFPQVFSKTIEQAEIDTENAYKAYTQELNWLSSDRRALMLNLSAKAKQAFHQAVEYVDQHTVVGETVRGVGAAVQLAKTGKFKHAAYSASVPLIHAVQTVANKVFENQFPLAAESMKYEEKIKKIEEGET